MIGICIKKVKIFLKSNIIGIIIGIIIAGPTVFAATTLISQSVYYNNTNSGATSTNVQGALDELYTKSDTWIDPTKIRNLGFYMNSGHTMLANSEGLIIKRNGTVHVIKRNNWPEEQNHIQEVFSDISCDVDSSSVDCRASDFRCYGYSNGRVRCFDYSVESNCDVSSYGSVVCN